MNKALHGRLVDSLVTSPSTNENKVTKTASVVHSPRHSGRDRAVRMLSRMGPPARVRGFASYATLRRLVLTNQHPISPLWKKA